MRLLGTRDPNAVVEVLARTPGILFPLLQEIPPDRLKKHPAPGRWSAHENACHLTSFDGLFERRLDHLLSGTNTEIVSYRMDPADQDGALLEVDLDRALKEFAEARPRLVDRLRQLRREDWERPGRHEVYEKMNPFILFRHLTLHDMIHTYRIEEMLWRRES